MALETITVPRAWIREHGWPDRYAELQVLVAAHAPGFACGERPRGEWMALAYQVPAPEVALFRADRDGAAWLYVQAWDGAA